MENFSAKRSFFTSSVYQGSRLYQTTFDRLLALEFEWRKPLLIFAIWRLGLLILPFLAALVEVSGKHAGTAPYTIVNYYQGTTDFWTDRLFAAWGRWDGEWYLQIINFGYTPPEATPAFFPLYPLLVRLTGQFAHLSYLVAGVFISALFSAAAFIVFYNLAFRDFQSKKLAGKALLTMGLFPTVFFLSAIYTEALFMTLALAAFFCARHLRISAKWWLAGFFAALATLTRNVGVIVAVALAWEWWQQHRQGSKLFQFKPGSIKKLVGLVGLPVIALAGWLGALWFAFGSPLAFVKAQSSSYWERRSAMPWETCWQALTQLFSPRTFSDSNVIDLLTLIAWITLVIMGIRLVRQGKFPVSYLIFMVLAFLPGLTQPRANEALFGLPRYLLVLFPAFQIIALSLPQTRWFRVSYFVASGMALAYLTIHFVQWGWVA